MRLPRLRVVLQALGAVAAVGLVAGLVAPMLGLVSITASSGHWDVTDWFLHTAMRRAVATQSLGISPPPLDDAAKIAEGAGHFEIGCAPCHGRPGVAPPPIPERMTPPPPYLPPRIAEWEPRELFFIVKHGVKFTGMPAWAAQRRDDEVWSVVAFLLALPELDESEYVALAYGDAEAPADAVAAASLCVRCHGADGRGRDDGDAFPRLAGLDAQYLHATLQSYAGGLRPSGIMEPIAATLDPEAMRRVANFYGRDLPAAPASADDAAATERLRERGRLIAADGIPSRDVAPCAYCHGPEQVARNPLFPRLAGQPRTYLERQLELWTAGGRAGTDYAEVMYEAAKELEPDEVAAVAAYYAALPPVGR